MVGSEDTLLSLVSLLLQLVGFVTPWWEVKVEGNTTEAINIWYTRVSEVETTRVDTLEQYGINGTLLSPRVEATTALIACLIAFILQMTMLCSHVLQLNIRVNMAVCVLSLISGMLPIVTAGRQTVTMLYGLSRDPPYVISFPTSLLINGLGGILSLVLCCMYMARICSLYNCNNDNYQSMQADYQLLQTQVKNEPEVQRKTTHIRTVELSLLPYPHLKYIEHTAL